MPYLKLTVLLTALLCGSAFADVWKWVDASGKTHFVDTKISIYTWVDESGKAFYSDTPDHEDAVAVQLVWVAKGDLDDLQASASDSSDGSAYPGETPDERAEREDAEAYYCKRATEIYESYESAPRLYRTNEAGEREYLSDTDAKATLDATKAKMDDLCN